jgi:TfoX/Sxy family transcriptional regulator of competence genes
MKFPPITEEMRRWCALIEAEVLTWPGVETRPMFGMTGFYRKDRIFAAIPKTRSLGKSDSVIFKLLGAPPDAVKRARAHPNTISGGMKAAGWIQFEVHSEKDVREALKWFSEAYECAVDQKPRRTATRRRRQ